MKKRLRFQVTIIMVLLLTMLLTACQGQVVTPEEPVETGTSVMIATVLEVPDQDQLLVEPVEGSSELRSADRIIVYTNNALVLDAEGDETTIENFEVGSRVEVTYDGMIAESYPAQITAQKVQQ